MSTKIENFSLPNSIDPKFISGNNGEFRNSGIPRKSRGAVIESLNNAKAGIEQALITAQATAYSAKVNAEAAIEVAKSDADVRRYEADQALVGVKEQAAVDKLAIEKEFEVEMAKLGVENKAIDKVDAVNAQANMISAQANLREAEGEYEYDKARGQAKLEGDNDNGLWG